MTKIHEVDELSHPHLNFIKVIIYAFFYLEVKQELMTRFIKIFFFRKPTKTPKNIDIIALAFEYLLLNRNSDVCRIFIT